MNNIYIHPAILGHPGRIAALEYSTGLRAVCRRGAPQLVHPSEVPAPPPRSILSPTFTLAGMNRLLNAINNPPGPEAA